MTATPLTENPALLDPRGTLTDAQRRALKLLDQHAQPAIMTRTGWLVGGNKRFGKDTAMALKEHGLVWRPKFTRLAITQTGRFCVERMEKRP